MKTRFDLTQDDIPQSWYNLLADFPEPLPPPLHPGTKQPMPPEALEAIFPRNLIEQELSSQRWIEVPEPVRDIYALWRPTPLLRAVRFEQALKTPAHIYYKYEGASPAGSHKPNTAVAQVYFNQAAGTKRLATETGAGQWGSSLAFACSLFGLECNVYMVKVSYDHKPYRRMLMHTWGATVHASPSDQTEYGRKLQAEDPHCPGSLGIAISEAIEDTLKHPHTKYSLGSVLNHVCLHQTVIGQETIQQMEMAGEEPDTIIGCCGGGSNFAGLAFPFLRKKIVEKKKYRIVGVEPSACPTLTKGELRYDFGRDDTAADDAHARTQVHAAGDSCGRTALSRHGTDGEPRVEAGADGSGSASSDESVRSRDAIRAQRRHRARAGIRSCDRVRGGRGCQSAPGRKETRDRLQSVRPRAVGSERLRKLSAREAAGCVRTAEFRSSGV
jgi:tryptophan synthase beta chain